MRSRDIPNDGGAAQPLQRELRRGFPIVFTLASEVLNHIGFLKDFSLL